MGVQTRRDEAWWRKAVLYQIYPRSFADSNGDGIGDLPGIVDRLDYLEWLGVDGIWLSPIFPSPNIDWGYDVADYTSVHPDLGTLADVDRLVEEAERRGIRVLLDLVPNHTSSAHGWFRERPELYVWSDEVPNNWRSIFGGPAWTLDPDRGRYYLHNFAAAQPDLDWWNPDVHDEFEGILRFWFQRGIAGFRIDVCHALYKDRDLRDEPAGDRPGEVRPVFSMNRPETHGVLREWRRLGDSFDPSRVLLGEVYVLDVPRWAGYYGSGSDELDLAFNFALVHSKLDAEEMRAVVAETEATLPNDAQPCWIGSNHDAGRLASRWCDGDEELARCALLVLLGLRGTPCLFQGDELALPNGHVPEDRIRDVATPSRDPCRTPFPWTPSGGWDDPWLPLEDTTRNAEGQRADPESTLRFARDLIALRRSLPDLTAGRYVDLDAPSGAWAWRRGDGVVVAVNLGGEPAEITGVAGELALATRRARDGETVAGSLVLGPAEGVVVRA
jgi:alpha-glucosidase